MAEVHLYPAALVPDNPNVTDGTPHRILGTVFYSDVDTYIVALEWLAPTTLPTAADMSLWSLTGNNPLATTGTRLDLEAFDIGDMTGGQWNRIDLPTPRFVAANTPRYVQIHIEGDRYVYSNPNDFPIDSDDGSLHTYGSEEAGNGRWRNSGDNDDIADTNPGSRGYNFFVGVVTNTSPVTEANATLDIVLPATVADTTGQAPAAATLDIALPVPVADADADVPAAGVLDIVLPAVVADTTAAAVAAATLDLILPVPVQDGEGEPVAAGVLDIVLPATVADTTGQAPAAATLDIALPVPVPALTSADLSAAATLDIVLPAVVADTTAAAVAAATLEVLLPSPTVSSAAAGPAAAAVITEAQDIETVTVIRPPGRDRFGDPIPGTAVEFDVPGCLFAPGPSREETFAAHTVDTDGTIYGPAGMDIAATDRVRVRGEVYTVDGKPQRWGTFGVVVAVRLVTG